MQKPSEHDGLESGAISQFSEAMAAEIGVGRFRFEELRCPPEPDGYCLLDGAPLHVEVGHVYGTSVDARYLLDRAGRSAPSQEQRLRAALIPLDDRVLAPLNELLKNKATKTYRASRIWLLIRSAFPLWRVDDFKKYQSRIHVPVAHPFEQIWLMCGPRVSFGVLRLA